MPYIVAVEGPLKGERFEILKPTVLGRAVDTDIQLDDLTASRRHCQLVPDATGFTVEDMGSGNGTLLNDNITQGVTPLKSGDMLTVATSVFRVIISQEADTAPAPARMPSPSVTLIDVPQPKQAPIIETIDVAATMIGAPLASPKAADKDQERLRTVLEISNAVGGELELDKLLDRIMDSFLHVFPQMDRGFIMLKEEGEEDLQPAVARQRGSDEPPAVSVSKNIIQEAFERKLAVLSADAMDDQRFAGAMSVMNFQIRSMMCAPLMTRSGEVLGVIHVDTSRQDSRFAMDDLELFAAVSSQTAMAIHNARMHEHMVKRERMERDLALARKVQHSFLPGEPPEIEGMEFYAHYNAALEVGGDFYDWIPLNDGRWGIVLGDVAGKGIPAALMMARMMSDVRFLLLAHGDAGKVLDGLNDGVIDRGMDDAFVTVVFMIFDPATRKVILANAAHCPPVLRKGATGEISEIQEEISFPIGALPGNEYPIETLTLEPGDSLTFFTDGVTEAMNAKHELYGEDRMRATLASATVSNAGDLMEALLVDIKEHVGDTYQSDDLTIVTFGVKPDAAPLAAPKASGEDDELQLA
jgi:phosphoserine phosphatase RsbU/P